MPIVLLSAGIAAGVAIILTIIDLIRTIGVSDFSKAHKPGYSLAAGVVTFVAVWFFSWLYFYSGTPALSGGNILWMSLWYLIIGGAIFGAITGSRKRVSLAAVVAGSLAVVMLLGYGVVASWPYGQDNADKLAGLVDMKVYDDSKEYAAADPNHVISVNPDMAKDKANTALNNKSSINTYYDLDGAPTLQIVGDKAYWIYELKLGDKVKKRHRIRLKNMIPGYVAVDAEDANASATLRDTYKMKINRHGPYSQSLDRTIYGEYPKYFVDKVVLQVMDDWTPYYTTALNKPALRAERAIPELFITINPVDGKPTEYQLKDVPTWVDRVYSEDTAVLMANWWGRWWKAKYNYWTETARNRYQATEDQPNLVYTKEGRLAYQILMGKFGDDEATTVNYIVRLDPATGKAEAYKAPKGLKTEKYTRDTIEDNEDILKKRDLVQLGLYKINNRLTWTGTLISERNRTYAGTAYVTAINPNSTDVQYYRNQATALQLYYAWQPAPNQIPGEAPAKFTITGTITDVSVPYPVKDLTYIAVKLDNDKGRRYVGIITDADNMVDLMFADPGDKVTITFLEIRGTLTPKRTISSIMEEPLKK